MIVLDMLALKGSSTMQVYSFIWSTPDSHNFKSYDSCVHSHCCAIFTKTNNFRDFLFVSLKTKLFQKGRGSFLKAKNLLQEQVLFFKSRPTEKGGKNASSRIASTKVCPFIPFILEMLTNHLKIIEIAEIYMSPVLT